MKVALTSIWNIVTSNPMNKDQYLSYFNTTQQKFTLEEDSKETTSRPKTSQYCHKNRKMLPHITEEYQYRITNQLLAEKIAHPRRDKLITASFSNQQDAHPRSDRKKMSPWLKSHQKENYERRVNEKYDDEAGGEGCEDMNGKTFQNKRLHKKTPRQSSSKPKKDYQISLQNSRMGKRILNTRSAVQEILTNTYFTYQIYNGKIANRDHFPINKNSIQTRSSKKHFQKVNNGIKYYFDKTFTEDDKDGTLRREHSSHFVLKNCSPLKTPVQKVKSMAESPIKENTFLPFERIIPSVWETYGQGDLNFSINQLFIDSNPPLKPDTHLVLQLIEKDEKLAHILSNQYAEKNNFVKQICTTEGEDRPSNRHCYTTVRFPYHSISTQNGGFGIKFRFHYRNHVFLRVLKAQGLEQRELGVIRIDLHPFKTRIAVDFPFRIIKQIRQVNGVNYSREIFESSFEGKLYKFKKGEIGTVLSFSYQLYHRNFKPEHQKNACS